jgi:hypothetical protein
MEEGKGQIVQHTRLEALLEELREDTTHLTVRIDRRTRAKTYEGVENCTVLLVVTACYETATKRNPNTIYLWVAEAGFYQQVGEDDFISEFSRAEVLKAVRQNTEQLKRIMEEYLEIKVRQGMYSVPAELLNFTGITKLVDLYELYRVKGNGESDVKSRRE